VVAAPGCNATAVALALLPLASAGLLGEDTACTVVSGASGAGRAPAQPLHFSELDGSARAYKPAGAHRHLAEIEATLGRAAGQGRALSTHAPYRPHRVALTPHLAPMTRGILASCTARLTRDADQETLFETYRDYYARDAMVHVQEALPETKAVAGSDRALVSLRVDPRDGRVSAFCVIDNLGKGAAGQAVQGFNVAFSHPETSALEMEAQWP
ncbi:MAG: Asd/ArgC dimerization domain-containing protein, partial [Jiangellaceae bacterium]